MPGVRPATFLVLLLATITGANLFTEPYLLTGGGGPNGASASPVLLMYQKGIEQGNPDVASAIGVILIILVLIIAGPAQRSPRIGRRCTAPAGHRHVGPRRPAARRPARLAARSTCVHVVLGSARSSFLFPFYYMVIGSLQTVLDPTDRRARSPIPANLGVENYIAINERINLAQGLVNSGIFTGGVLLGTVVFGVLAGLRPRRSCTGAVAASSSPSRCSCRSCRSSC